MTAPDLAQRLAAVEARLALQELLGRYAIAVDDHDADALGDCFTQDGSFGSANSGGSVGRAAVVEGFRLRFDRDGPTLHVPQYQVLSRLGTSTARGTVVGYAELARDGQTLVTSIRYDDEYAVEDGMWRFGSRQVHTLYAMPLPDLVAGGLAWADRKRWPGAVSSAGELPLWG